MPRPLSSRRILLTAGPTREPIDPVRYISNQSSGEMGLSLAGALATLGGRVTVVLGPVERPVPRGIEVIRVTTAREMAAAVARRIRRSDAFIATAAVCDWRVASPKRQKLKKTARPPALRLVRNPDILAMAGRRRGLRARPVLVGFALETRHLERYARQKLSAKNLDLVIGNTPATFGGSTIRPLWVERIGKARRLPLMSKKTLSSKIGRWLAVRLARSKEK